VLQDCNELVLQYLTVGHLFYCLIYALSNTPLGVGKKMRVRFKLGATGPRVIWWLASACARPPWRRLCPSSPERPAPSRRSSHGFAMVANFGHIYWIVGCMRKGAGDLPRSSCPPGSELLHTSALSSTSCRLFEDIFCVLELWRHIITRYYL